MEIANGVVGFELLRPRRTGCLWLLSVMNWPDGLALTMRSLKELVPMSMVAKREEEGDEVGEVVAISVFLIILIEVKLFFGVFIKEEFFAYKKTSTKIITCCKNVVVIYSKF